MELARFHGVVPRYRQLDGNVREASEPALLAVLRALGLSLDSPSDVAHALETRRRELEARLAGPAVVTWLPGPARLHLRAPEGATGSARLLVSLEQGGLIRREARIRDLPVHGRRAVLTLDTELPPGVHRATLSLGETEQRLLWIAAPRRAWPVAARTTGAFAPLHALRSDRRPDLADLGDLERLACTLAAEGVQLIATLPLDSAYLEPPVEPGPYAPVSRMFWNEAYLDLERLPELGACEPARRALRAAASGPPDADTVDWPAVAGVRRHVLGLLAEEHCRRAPGSPELRAFADRQPLLEDYATFRALAEEHGRNWRAWPDPLPEAEPRLRHHHLYVQWRMHQQLEAMTGRLRARDIGLYLDVPLGAHPDGFDAWRYPRSFLSGCSAGAPPDPFFREGQDWGFSPPHSQGAREDGGYAYFRHSLRHHMRHCRVLRLDHVMGLYRVFCIPHGMPATEGVYLRQPAEELFALVCLESTRHRCAVVGEDLGTVPETLRRRMAEHGLLSMHVLQFELDAQDAGRSLAPPAGTLTALNTHDMPTFAGFWSAADVDDRLDLGLLDEDEAAEERSSRGTLRAVLRQVLELPDADPERVLHALLLRLAASEADILVVNLEDLWLETRPQNVPGTTTERPNWRRRMRRSLAELAADARLRQLLRKIVSTRGEATDDKPREHRPAR